MADINIFQLLALLGIVGVGYMWFTKRKSSEETKDEQQ